MHETHLIVVHDASNITTDVVGCLLDSACFEWIPDDIAEIILLKVMAHPQVVSNLMSYNLNSKCLLV